MGIIIWLIVGGICGWLASLIMRTDAQQGSSLTSSSASSAPQSPASCSAAGILNNGLTVESFLYSLLGAVVLLAIVNLVRRGSAALERLHLDKKGRAGPPRGPFLRACYCSSNVIATLT